MTKPVLRLEDDSKALNIMLAAFENEGGVLGQTGNPCAAVDVETTSSEEAESAGTAVAPAASKRADEAVAGAAEVARRRVEKGTRIVDGARKFVTEHSTADIAAEITGLFRRGPTVALWCGVGIGLLLGVAWARR